MVPCSLPLRLDWVNRSNGLKTATKLGCALTARARCGAALAFARSALAYALERERYEASELSRQPEAHATLVRE